MNVTREDIAAQTAVISGIPLCFMVLAAVRNRLFVIDYPYVGILLVLLFIFVFSIMNCCKCVINVIHNKNIISFFFSNPYILLFSVLFLVLRIQQFAVLPRWDSGTYFYCIQEACRNFNFTLSSFFRVFKLGGHISYGCSIFWAIGYYLFPDSFLGIYVVNLVLAFVAFYMTYGILRRYLSGRDQFLISFGTFIIWCQPMNLGLFHGIAPDSAVMIFSIYILYFHIYKKYLLMCFFAVMLMTSKEVGVVCIVGYCVGYILCLYIAPNQSRKRSIKNVIRDKLAMGMLCVGLLGIIVLIYLVFIKKDSWMDNYGKGSYGGVFNIFALRWDYIWLKLKTLFIINFYWIWMIVIIICIVLGIHKGKILFQTVFDCYRELFCCICGIGAFVLFSIMYITYNNPRYHLCVEYTLALTGIFSLLLVFGLQYRNVLVGVFSLFLVMMTGEAYLTIDPITKMVFPIINTASAFPMVTVGWKENPSLKADITIYNFQYVYLDKAYEQILKEIDYNEDIDLVLWGHYEKQTRAVSIEGWNVTFYWDTLKKMRTINKNENTIHINPIFETNFDELYDNGLLSDTAVWIFTPHFQDNEAELFAELDDYYHIDRERHVAGTLYGGKVYYYMMELR